MRYHWPADTVFTQQVLTVEQQDCSLCRRALNICDHRIHRIFTLQGPVEIVCKLVHASGSSRSRKMCHSPQLYPPRLEWGASEATASSTSSRSPYHRASSPMLTPCTQRVSPL